MTNLYAYKVDLRVAADTLVTGDCAPSVLVMLCSSAASVVPRLDHNRPDLLVAYATPLLIAGCHVLVVLCVLRRRCGCVQMPNKPDHWVLPPGGKLPLEADLRKEVRGCASHFHDLVHRQHLTVVPWRICGCMVHTCLGSSSGCCHCESMPQQPQRAADDD
jgi:hypothetical protein